MDEVGEMEVFVRVVERTSFSGAAEALGVTPSAFSKHVTRLEDRLRVRLLHRTTRCLSLTPEGEIYHARVRDILAAIAEAEGEVADRSLEPKGLLRVNAVTPFAFHCLSEALPEFIMRYPWLEVALAVTERIVDLIEDGADVALRTGASTRIRWSRGGSVPGNAASTPHPTFSRVMACPHRLRR